MVSQGSNCDSDDIPAYMQDFLELQSDFKGGNEVGEISPQESLPHKGAGIMNSTDGVADVMGSVESPKEFGTSMTSWTTEDEARIFEDDRAAMERETVHRVAKMAFASNREEREELISLRKKLIEVNLYLEKNGLSMVECEKASMEEKAKFNSGFTHPNSFITGREEYGLPMFSNKVNVQQPSNGSGLPFVEGVGAGRPCSA